MIVGTKNHGRLQTEREIKPVSLVFMRGYRLVARMETLLTPHFAVAPLALLEMN